MEVHTIGSRAAIHFYLDVVCCRRHRQHKSGRANQIRGVASGNVFFIYKKDLSETPRRFLYLEQNWPL